MPRKYEDLRARIIGNTILSEENFYDGTPCWEWIGAYTTGRTGIRYGKLDVRTNGKRKTWGAHRLSLKEFRGRRMTRDVVVRHLCNNTICVNPMHLVGGTQTSNMRQMVRQGRHRNMYSTQPEHTAPPAAAALHG